jgi:hypothetical protein
MTIDLLLTLEMRETMPDTIKEVFNFGNTQVVFPAINPKEDPLIIVGDSVVLEGETDEIVKWLKPFDGVAVGCGVPQLERFTIMHINDNL